MLKNISSKYIKYISSLLMVLTLLVLPFFAFGQDQFGTSYLSEVGLGTQDIRVTILKIIRIAFGILGVITLVLIIYAGVIWMTSGGKQESIAKAKKIIINAVIGLIIIILAAAITEFVFRQINNATNPEDDGNGLICTPADTWLSACVYCNSSGLTEVTPGCLGTNAFELREVQTAHGGTDPKQDVYLCSRVQPRFNNIVDQSTVLGNVRVTDLSGVEVSGTWNTSGNILQFVPDNNFAPNASYEVRLSNTLTDASGDFLAGCNGTVCESLPPTYSYYGWQFITGVDTDIIAPHITSAYPSLDNTNRTVSRAPIIDVTYNEAIDFLSIADSSSPPHPQLGKFVLQALDGPGGSTVGTAIDNTNLLVTAKDNGFRVQIDSTSGLLLDGFTWYRITVADVMDLCGNNQQPSPVIWEFQTNNAVPGVTGYSPTGSNSCPNEVIIFTFGTSMYGQEVDLNFNGQVISLIPDELYTYTTSAFGTLSVMDVNIVPGAGYRNFKFIPSNPLIVGTTYNMTILAPGMVIDSNGNTIFQSWEFSVASADQCSCSPYIAYLSPNQGSIGQCLTINGSCFAGTMDNPGLLTAIHFIDSSANTTNAVIAGQSGNFATTDVPNTLSPDTYNVEVTLDYEDANFGSITSNQIEFVVDDGPTYTGPCLYLIDPVQACHNSSLTLSGARLGVDPGAGNYDTVSEYVNFSASGHVPDANFSSWSNQTVRFNLPTGFQDSDVSITVGGQNSNALPFDVACGTGSWCSSTAAPICTPNNNQCTSGLCNLSTCLCETSLGGSDDSNFVVINKWPTCDTACPNSILGANFSHAIDSSTLNNSSILVYECTDGVACLVLNNIDKTWEATANNLDINAGVLNINTYYRVVITNQVTDTTGTFLGGLNYDVNKDEVNDAYSWIFKTKVDNCNITSVDIVPDNMSFTDLGVWQKITGRAMSNDGCYGNQPIISTGLNWFWTQDNPAIAAVTYDDLNNDGLTDSIQYVESRGLGDTNIIGSIPALAFADQTLVHISLAFNIEAVWPACDTACINSEIGMRLSSNIDSSTVAVDDFDLYICNDGATCHVLTPVNFTEQVVGTDQIIIQPDSDLQLDIYHRVVVHDAFQGLNGESITNLNYDANFDSVNDSYSWIFKTNDKICNITSVSTYPTQMTFNKLNQTQNIIGKALSNQGCVGGQYIDAWDYDWGWSVADAGVADLQSPLVDSNTDSLIDPMQSIISQSAGNTTAIGTAETFAANSDITVSGGNIASASCDGNAATSICEARPSNCSNITYCNPTSCLCETPPAPSVVSIDPASPTILECANTAFTVVFSQPMNTTDAKNYFELELDNVGLLDINVQSYAITNGTDGCTWSEGCTGFIISPAELITDSFLLELNISRDITSIYGQNLESQYTYNYQSGTKLCNLDGVSLLPHSWMFTTNLPPDNTVDFIAQGYTNEFGGYYIAPLPNYSWNYTWTENDLDNFINTNPTNNINTVTVINHGQGMSYLTAQADIVTDNINNPSQVGYSFSNTAQIEIFICDYPWPDPPPYDLDHHAYMKYCRGNIGDDVLLPNLSQPTNLSGSQGDLLLDQIFSVEGTESASGLDAIGLRIYHNPNHASAEGWYSSRDFLQGSPRNTVINGYPAVVDGRTTYIHFTDINNGNILSYILVLSYNQDAQSSTIDIYHALLDGLRFNTNITNTEKNYILEDIDRIGGVGFIIEKLREYETANGSLPDLSTGSFISGQSTSRWPQSWQTVLGNALGTRLPVDPDNIFNNCPTELGYDAQSCYNVNLTPQFLCPTGSHIYIYQDGTVYANPKYKNVTWLGIGSVDGSDSCTSFSLSVDNDNYLIE